MPLTGRPLRCEGGRIKAFICDNIELLAYLPADSIGGASGSDLWGWHDSTTGREFLVVGGRSRRATTAFIEVTDPVNPKYLGVLPPRGGETINVSQSVKVYRNYAFIGYDGSGYREYGIQVFDLTQLRDVQRPQTFHETAYYDSVANTHTIAVNQETGFLYVNGSTTGRRTCGGGLHMVDVRVPTHPTYVGCYPETLGRGQEGYVHDAQCTIYRGPDKEYRGREICVNYAGSGIGIVDVTDKQHPKAISTFAYPNVGYAHQGWFTMDQRYIFLDDEFDEINRATAVGRDRVPTRTIGVDLRDLDDPVLLIEFYNDKSRAVDHNLYIRGHYMYQGNYGAGLRVIDVSDPRKPREVGFLSRKQDDNEGPSAWGPYPYFKDGVVAVSMSTGLVLVRLLTR